MSDKLGEKYLNKMQDGRPDDPKTQMIKVFDEFKEILSDKQHPDNHSPAYHKKVQGTIQRLLVAANNLDQESPGEGIFALFTLLLSTSLKLKDKIISLEVENNKLRKLVNKKNG